MSDPASRDGPARPRISVCLITKNEEAHVRECLESVDWADEIVVVDSFSTDRTVEMARTFTDKVVQREWPGINAQRQFALEQATGEWVFCIDADERVSPELRQSILAAFRDGEPACDGFYCARLTRFLGRWIRHSGWYPDYKLRLFRRSKGRFGDNDPHDQVLLEGPTRKLKGDLIHHTYRDLAHNVATVNSFTSTAVEGVHRRGGRFRVTMILLDPPVTFFKKVVLQRGFLDGVPGVIIAVVSAFRAFLKQAKLWELQRNASGSRTTDAEEEGA